MIDRSQALQTFRVKRVSVGVAIKCKSLLERKTHGLNLGRTDDDGIVQLFMKEITIEMGYNVSIFRNAELSVLTQILYTVHFADKITSGTTFCIATVYKSA